MNGPMEDPRGKIAKVEWMMITTRIVKGLKLECRVVAQELGFGERLDELFLGAPF